MYQKMKKAFVLSLLSLICLAVHAQKTVTGIVKDSKGEPMIGVSITRDGASGQGTITDMDGKFTVTNVSPQSVLNFTYIGYKAQSVKVGGRESLNIIMEEDDTTLDELVVVGYGTMRKRDLTGSISSVNSEKISARGATSVAEAMQGAVAGVSITQSGSRAGGGFDIQIRGQASINNQSQPLYVIDGVVCSSMDFLNPEDIERVDILKDASSTAIYGSRASAGVVVITTKGSRGADKASKPVISYDGYYGVKKVARMPEFMNANEFIDYRFARYTELTSDTYDGSFYKGVDASGHPNYTISEANLNTAFVMRKNGTSYRDSKLYEMMMDPSFSGYDWKKLVTRTASQQNHFISASGATDRLNYRIGIGYQSDENVFKANDYERFNIKGAVDAKLSKIFEAGLSVNMSYSKTNDFCTDSSYSPYMKAFYFNPFVSPTDETGALIHNPGAKSAFDSNSQFTSTENPLIDLQNNNYIDDTKDYNVLANVYLRANIMKGLKFTTTFSPNYYHSNNGVFYATGLKQDDTMGSTYYQKNKTNFGSVENTTRFDWTWDNQIDYSLTLGDHSLNAMGLFSLYKTNTEGSYLSGKGIANDLLTYYNLETASGDKVIKSSYTESSLESFAMRLNYSYKGKYMATATVRTDGSSRFADGNRWGWFPSFAAAWRITEEPWMKQYRWLDNLKLRASYGVTGNNNVGDYVTVGSSAGPTYVVLDGSETQAYYPNGLINRDLIWEKVKEFDLGLDVSVLNSRINLTADFYNRLSDGQIMSRAVPLETGEKSMTYNIGSVQNRGIELGLQFGIIRKKDFTWDVSVNFARNWNKIKELSNGKVDEVASNLFIGMPLNVLRDYTHTDVITDKGVTMHTYNGDKHYTLEEFYQKYGKKYKWYEGQMAVNDWNDDGVIDENDKRIYGCTDPRWTGSLTSTLYFKGFDFTVMLYTKSGFWSHSYFHDGNYMKWSDRGNSHMKLDYYIPKGAPIIDHTTGDIIANPETHYGKYPYPNNSDASAGGYFGDKGSAKGENYQYQKTSFTKVKNITLGYTFPRSIINHIGLQQLRLYVNVLNPFCFTNYEGFDPEWASQSLLDGGPASVTWQFGVNLKF